MGWTFAIIGFVSLLIANILFGEHKHTTSATTYTVTYDNIGKKRKIAFYVTLILGFVFLLAGCVIGLK
jgi:hypothetical protein